MQGLACTGSCPTEHGYQPHLPSPAAAAEPVKSNCLFCMAAMYAGFIAITIKHKYKLLQPFNGLFSRTTWVSRYQIGKTNLDFTGARDSEWQWNQLGHMQVCTSLQTDNHASTPPLCFLQAGCPSCRPTNSVKALKAQIQTTL